MTRIVEHGPSVGQHRGRPIPAYFVDEHGTRYIFDRTAELDADGGFELDRLGPGENIIAPGLIYKLSNKQE